jgi:hypothetical protein
MARCANLGAPSATNTRKDRFFSFAAYRNSFTVLERPRVRMTSLEKTKILIRHNWYLNHKKKDVSDDHRY